MSGVVTVYRSTGIDSEEKVANIWVSNDKLDSDNKKFLDVILNSEIRGKGGVLCKTPDEILNGLHFHLKSAYIYASKPRKK